LHVTDYADEPRVTFCDSFVFTPAFFVGTVTVAAGLQYSNLKKLMVFSNFRWLRLLHAKTSRICNHTTRLLVFLWAAFVTGNQLHSPTVSWIFLSRDQNKVAKISLSETENINGFMNFTAPPVNERGSRFELFLCWQ